MKKIILKIEVLGILTVVLVGLIPIHQIYAQQQGVSQCYTSTGNAIPLSAIGSPALCTPPNSWHGYVAPPQSRTTAAPVASPTVMEDYTVLTPLPGTTKGVCNNPGDAGCKTDLKTYLEGFFKLAIGLSAVAAVLMIVIGGFQYISTDALMKKEEGRNRIQNAVFGLVLVIGAWLILATINPNLLKINLDIEPVPTNAPTGIILGGELSAGTGKALAWYPLSPTEVTLNNDMRTDLKNNYHINVNGGPCTTSGQVTGCTNLVGMPPTTFSGVTNLKSVCSSCNITISGGTEGGHKSHGPNLAPIDLLPDSNLNNFITSNKIKTVDSSGNEIANPRQTSLGPIYTSKVGNRNATFLNEGNHWHVVFQ